MNRTRGDVVAEGTAANGDDWTMLYQPRGEGGTHYIALLINGILDDEASGIDLPDVTEVGFSGGLKPGFGQFYLYGIVTTRIASIRAETQDGRDNSVVPTVAISAAAHGDSAAIRGFVIVRPPVENVVALVGLDAAGNTVQRVRLPGPRR